VVGEADEDVMSARAGNLPPRTFAELATLAYDVGEPEYE